MYASLDSQYTSYPSSGAYPNYFEAQPQIINSIEFTDLTRPQMEDRRRNKLNSTQDKEAMSNMRIVSTHYSLLIFIICALLTDPTAPSRTKSGLAACIQGAQREARPASGTRARRTREETSDPRKVIHRSRQHCCQAKARGQTIAQ